MSTHLKLPYRRAHVSIAMAAIALVGLGFNARAWQEDPPLTVRNIKLHWETNPQQDVRAYIDRTLKIRKVGFLPTTGIRRELCDHMVPIEVINELKLNVHDDGRFQYQVWSFDSGPGLLMAADTTRLAQNVIQQLRNRNGEMSDVFRHFKAPLPEPCVQTSGSPACSTATGPRLHVKGTIERSGSRLKAIVRLSYVSPSENLPLGREARTTIIVNRDEAGLMSAAADIVSKIHQSIKEEMTEPFTCQ
ncbi:MAG: hypothetical protein ACRD9R_10105 [Pyrinomonadaceae bacterium]